MATQPGVPQDAPQVSEIVELDPSMIGEVFPPLYEGI